MKHVFVFDLKAFFNQQWKMDGILDGIGQFFRKQDKPDFSIQMSRYRRHAITLIQQEVDKATPGKIIRVYAVGGEEILYDCVNAVAHMKDMQLAVVPHGETCDFLHVFGADTDSFKDIPVLVKKAETLSTDVIQWDVNYALNSCYIGVNSATAFKLRELKSKLGKRSFFVFSRVSSFFNNIGTAFDKEITAQQYSITIDNKDYTGSYSFIHVANGPYYAGKKTGASNATPNDGFLDVTLIKSTGPLRTILSIRKYSRGKRNRNCISVKAKKISIQSEKQMWIQMDNEYFQDTNININVVNHAVQIVVPDNLTYPLATNSGL